MVKKFKKPITANVIGSCKRKIFLKGINKIDIIIKPRNIQIPRFEGKWAPKYKKSAIVKKTKKINLISYDSLLIKILHTSAPFFKVHKNVFLDPSRRTYEDFLHLVFNGFPCSFFLTHLPFGDPYN